MVPAEGGFIDLGECQAAPLANVGNVGEVVTEGTSDYQALIV